MGEEDPSMSKQMGMLLLLAGLVMLAHAGYSTIQYRKYLRMVDQDFNGSPYDVHIGCAIGFLLCLVGCVSYADDLKPIRLAQTFHDKTVDDMSFRPDFMTFNHRGRALGLFMKAAGAGFGNKRS